MNILVVNHTSRISGAERGLLDLLSGLPPSVTMAVACPPGPLADALTERHVRVLTIPECTPSFRTAPWRLSLMVPQLLVAALTIRWWASRRDVDLIYANTIRAGMIVGIAAAAGPPVILHVHDCLPKTRRANLLRGFLLKTATTVLANSSYTARNFVSGQAHPFVRVVYNAVNLDRFDPGRVSRAAARARLRIGLDTPLLGQVGQISPWKGQSDAIQAVALLRTTNPSIRLALVGDTSFTHRDARYNNSVYLSSLHEMVRRLGLDEHVLFLGERDDLPEILRALDVLLVPSWEEPFGRAAIEAMAMECAVVATSIGGPAEIITNGEDGFLLPPHQPERWADALRSLLAQPAERAEIGEKARRRVVAAFSRERYVAGVMRACVDSIQRVQSSRRVA